MSEHSVGAARQAGTTPVSEQTRHLAYAEASVMLIESLMLLLIEKGLCTNEQIVEAVETALDAKRQLAHEGEHRRIATVAAGVLSTLANSIAAGRDGGG
jgi:hypothetical protein